MFNVYNIMAAAGAAHLLGISPADISSGIRELPGVPGRFEKIDTGQQFSVIVDYAHTPDGLENVLSTIKQLNQKKGRIITIFGCGGDRDKQKRKLMGQVSSKYSDISIITSDNPRTENPSAIIGMIEQGFGAQDSYLVIEDRRKAIEEGLSIARPKDIILIAGKGHEDYQEFADYRIHFSDQETVKDILKG
jgi:UDP-N-acetylmuramoyl-L-alanyl-D-glutamate--2,6-diaminopimelate ligase